MSMQVLVDDVPARRAFAGMCLAIIGALVYREISPYSRVTTNILNLVVQYQIFLLYMYALLLVHHDGIGYTETSVLAGQDPRTVGSIMVLGNLACFAAIFFFAARYFVQYRRKERLIREKMAGELSRRQALQAQHGQALPPVLQNFTPFSERPQVAGNFARLDEMAEEATRFVENEKASQRKSRRMRSSAKKSLTRSSWVRFNTRATEPPEELGIKEETSHKANGADAPEAPSAAEQGERSPDPMNSMRSIKNSKKGLVLLKPLSVTKVMGSLGKVTAENEVEKLQDFVNTMWDNLVDEVDDYCTQDGIIGTCDEVLAASGQGFEGMYRAVWNLVLLVEDGQLDLYLNTIRSLKLAAEESPGRGKVQQMETEYVGLLFSHAAEVRSTFKSAIEAIGEATGAKVDVAPMKRLSRICEKILFDNENDAFHSCAKVADIVRAMLTATSMSQVVSIAIALYKSEDIVIVRVKDRFIEKPSAGGWRDLMLNIFFESDPNQHICEVQIVLEKMLVARKGLGGHEGYDKSRNALEILEKLHLSDVGTRWMRAKYLHDVDGVQAPDMLSLGFNVHDLLRAGYDALELYGHSEATDAAISRAVKEVADEERAQAKSKKRLSSSFRRALSRQGSEPGSAKVFSADPSFVAMAQRERKRMNKTKKGKAVAPLTH